MTTAIRIDNVGKAFVSYRNEWLRFARWFGFSSIKPSNALWTLRNISFDIQRGEAVGIIGQNGAGKSTLLKIITGTLKPSEGGLEIFGRISAILELGMGFNPELTGRQNVYHAAGLMGFSLRQIDEAISDIESFADIGDYFDSPVRVYSSGMHVRVAFAVATAWRPDILIIDEALSVGDAAFQRKCYQRIDDYRADGTTLLFVTHDIETVKKICDRALFLRDGRVFAFDKAKIVCDEYEQVLFGKNKPSLVINDETEVIMEKPSTMVIDHSLISSSSAVYGNGKVHISNIRIESLCGQEINVITTGESVNLLLDINVGDVDILSPSFHLQIKTKEGVVIFGINSEHLNFNNLELLANKKITIKVSLENRLAPDLYFITCGIKESGIHGGDFCCRVVDGALLKVVDRDISTIARGVIDMRAKMTILDKVHE